MYIMSDTNINLLNEYINALILNIDPATLPKELNLIFDSGAVNGIIGIGAALYLYRLEQKGYTKINKVSGCSIGALIALCYLSGCPESMYKYMDILFQYYKKHKNFYIWHEIVHKIVDELCSSDDMTILNKRLYINYYDMKRCRQRVISKYKNKSHLITCILRSSHIPFLTSTEYKYQGRYIDGIAPYFFNKGTNLFIQLITLVKPLNSLIVKYETNIYTRLLRGVVDVNDFFINGESSMCCYVNDKSYILHLQLLLRKYFVFIILLLIELYIIIKNNMPVALRHTLIYSKLMFFSKKAWQQLQNKLV